MGLPLFCSGRGWNGDIRTWSGDSYEKLRLEGSFRLSYNASLFVREGLGYLLSFKHLIEASEESGLVFRPLDPVLEVAFYLTWNKYQTFTPIAERFLAQIRQAFSQAVT